MMPSRSVDDVLRPIYPATSALTSETIGKIVGAELPALLPEVEEWFDPSLLQSRGLLGRRDAFRLIHLPHDARRCGASAATAGVRRTHAHAISARPQQTAA